MAKKFKKIIAIFLTLTMILSMSGMTTVFAEDAVDGQEQTDENVTAGIGDSHTHGDSDWHCSVETTQGESPICNIEEHKHSSAEGCYENNYIYICGEESPNHVHSFPDCYELKCNKHVHNAACYQSTLTCGKEESEGHTHNEACYDENEELICEQEETEGHTHSDDCYEQIPICNIEETPGHEHTLDECAVSDGQSLTCEREEHTHTADCYESIPTGTYLCWKVENNTLYVVGHGTLTKKVTIPNVDYTSINITGEGDGGLVLSSNKGIYLEGSHENLSVFITNTEIQTGGIAGCTSLGEYDTFKSITMNGGKLGESSLPYAEESEITLDGTKIENRSFWGLSFGNDTGNVSKSVVSEITLNNIDVEKGSGKRIQQPEDFVFKKITFKSGSYAESYLFDSCKVGEMVIDGGSFGSYTFYRSQIKKLTINNGTFADATYPFHTCKVGEIDIIDGSFGNYTFYLSQIEEKLTVNNGKFSKGTFQQATIGGPVVIEGGSFDSNTFYKAVLPQITFDGKFTIGDNFCRDVTSLKTVNITENAAGIVIPSYTFMGCTGLETFNGFEYVVSIGRNAFRDCENLDFTTSVIPESVKLGYSNVFDNVDYLKERMEAIMQQSGRDFALSDVRTAEELTVPDGWTSSHAGNANGSNEIEKTQVTKAAKWTDETAGKAQVQFQFNYATKPGMDFLFLLDFSDSMGDIGSINNNDDSRFYDLQSKLLEVVTGEDGLLNNGDKYDNQFAYVSFGGSMGNGASIGSCDFTDDASVAKEAIRAMSPYYENTDYVAGLNKALEIINGHQSSGRDISVIFISDGQPTRNGEVVVNNSNWNDQLGEIKNAADRIRSLGVDIYGVMESVPSGEQAKAAAGMAAVCTESMYFKAEDTDSFSRAVNGAIGAAYKVYTLVDTIDPDFTLDEESIHVDVGEVTVGTNNADHTVITWTITDVPFTTHTMTYDITLIDSEGRYGNDINTNEGNAEIYESSVIDPGEESVNSVETPTLSRTEPTPPVEYYNLTVRYVDENGNEIQNSVTTSHESGSNYTIDTPEIENYTFDHVEGALSGTLTGNTTVTLFYRKTADIPEPTPPLSDTYTLTVNYVNEQGTAIYSQLNTSYTSGANYEVEIRDISGYRYVRFEGEALSGTIEKDLVVTLIYAAESYSPSYPSTTYYTVTVNYQDTEGNTLQPSTSTSYAYGSSYTVNVPTIDGYTFDHANGDLTGTVQGNVTVTLVYRQTTTIEPEPDPPLSGTIYTLTVNYVDEDGNTIRESYEEAHNDGDEYEVEIPVIKGYEYDSADGELNGTITEDTVVTLIYKQTTDIEDDDTPKSETPGSSNNPGSSTTTITSGSTPRSSAPSSTYSSGSSGSSGTASGSSSTTIEDTAVPLGDTPQTGDESPLVLWTVLLFGALLGMTAICKAQRRK